MRATDVRAVRRILRLQQHAEVAAGLLHPRPRHGMIGKDRGEDGPPAPAAHGHVHGAPTVVDLLVGPGVRGNQGVGEDGEFLFQRAGLLGPAQRRAAEVVHPAGHDHRVPVAQHPAGVADRVVHAVRPIAGDHEVGLPVDGVVVAVEVGLVLVAKEEVQRVAGRINPLALEPRVVRFFLLRLDEQARVIVVHRPVGDPVPRDVQAHRALHALGVQGGGRSGRGVEHLLAGGNADGPRAATQADGTLDLQLPAALPGDQPHVVGPRAERDALGRGQDVRVSPLAHRVRIHRHGVGAVVPGRAGEVPQHGIGPPLRVAGKVLLQPPLLAIGNRVLGQPGPVVVDGHPALVRVGRGLAVVGDVLGPVGIARQAKDPVVGMRFLQPLTVAVPAPPLPGQLVLVVGVVLERVLVVRADVEALVHVDGVRTAPQPHLYDVRLAVVEGRRHPRGQP